MVVGARFIIGRDNSMNFVVWETTQPMLQGKPASKLLLAISRSFLVEPCFNLLLVSGFTLWGFQKCLRACDEQTGYFNC